MVSEYIRKIMHPYRSKIERHLAELRESTSSTNIGDPGPIAIPIFESVKAIPGWFNLDDCGHFSLILSYQSAVGMQGDLFEIGSYHGRSTSVMARWLQPREKIVVCDAFESETDEPYDCKPSAEELISNILKVNPHVSRDRITVHECLSSELKLHDEEFRFIHIDGGHSAEQVYSDLGLSSRFLVRGGVVVVDDYHNKHWPGVTAGTDRFLEEETDVSVLADLNRHGAVGRKLYLVKKL